MRAGSGVGVEMIWFVTPNNDRIFNGTRVGVGGRVAVGRTGVFVFGISTTGGELGDASAFNGKKGS